MLVEEGIRKLPLLLLRDVHPCDGRHLALENLPERHRGLKGFIKPNEDITQPTDVTFTTHPYSLITLLPEATVQLHLPFLVLLGADECYNPTKEFSIQVVINRPTVLRVEPLVHVNCDTKELVIRRPHPTQPDKSQSLFRLLSLGDLHGEELLGCLVGLFRNSPSVDVLGIPSDSGKTSGSRCGWGRRSRQKDWFRTNPTS